ncbi:RNA helicase aquarius-like isoform X3 [Montipora capricornis]|uniref:RNA helicase aquarius-like isoform X3 n=1 Tax=Montipora capricornis TaxID=246305 RepID=UPI0035F1ECAC
MNRKATSGRGAVPTVEQISLDCITQLANQYWALGEDKKAYKPQIVDDICRKELEGCKFAVKRIMLLEFSQYLENYLWNLTLNPARGHCRSFNDVHYSDGE